MKSPIRRRSVTDSFSAFVCLALAMMVSGVIVGVQFQRTFVSQKPLTNPYLTSQTYSDEPIESGWEIVRVRPRSRDQHDPAENQDSRTDPGVETPLGSSLTDVSSLADEIERLEAGLGDGGDDVLDSGDDDLDQKQASAVSPSVAGALPSRTPWAGAFRKARRELLKVKPLCEGCGRSAEDVGRALNAHHVISVERIILEGLDHGLQWDIGNLIVLCRGDEPDEQCHLKLGHTVDGHSAWSVSNPNVRRDAAREFFRRNPGWTYEELVAEYEFNKPIAAEVVKPRRPSKTGTGTFSEDGNRASPRKTTTAP